ncbi:hypothetical protein FFLO_01806 [Filobasidium floriforme]|uniref:Uncharacterized protein n=1 Tax=Filobasidium floriforme TaxID=5210 RepID=A0A8K0NSF1_9TREE|nr:uncharacterized protein HD553DRAFT_310954 [Filobasidium floriforme]KAG7562745.1 hypothetical protein FFLO_01806 [Filobasidium floriforme]KAH8085275.1 hypothetical protein HD553DRAFT_310954 [Filobasidium floriforme]
MFAKQIITSILLAVAMTSVTAAPTVNERDIAIKGLTGGDFHLKQNDVDLEHSLRQRQMGGNAYTGASGNTDGGDAITYQGMGQGNRNGANNGGLLGGNGGLLGGSLLNLKAANMGGNGGRGGQSTTGNAHGGNGGAAMQQPAPAPAPQQNNAAPAPQQDHAAPAPQQNNAAPAPAPASAPMAGTGGNAYTGASGSAQGGNAVTHQEGLINADLLNLGGGNGGRGGMSGSGSAYAGHA